MRLTQNNSHTALPGDRGSGYGFGRFVLIAAMLVGLAACELPELGVSAVGRQLPPPDAPSVPEPVGIARVTDGLVAYYPLDEGSGSIVRDQSGSGQALDLEIVGDVDWLENGPGVRFSGGKIGTSAPATKILDALTAANSSSFEIWAVPANLTQSGPVRLLSLGDTVFRQSVMIGQDGAGYQIRFRHSGKNDAGRPRIETADGVTVAIQHIVHTYDGSVERLYIDGEEQPVGIPLSGDYSVWSQDDLLSIGNESDLLRPFDGYVYLVAVYDRALSIDEVAQNFVAGPVGSSERNLAPVVLAGADMTINQPGVAGLEGRVMDDSRPDNGESLSSDWTQVAGPGTATFFDSSLPTTTVAFDQPGTYTLRLSASDGERSASDDVRIVVTEFEQNNRPQLTAIDFNVFEGQSVTVGIQARDPDGDILVFEAGSLPSFMEFTDNGDGTATFLLAPDFSDAGEYSVEVQVRDDGQPPMVDTTTITIEVLDVDVPPRLRPLGPLEVVAGTVRAVNVRGENPDGDPFVIEALSLPDFASLTPGSNGSADLSLAPAPGDAGEYTATFRIADADDDSRATTESLDILVVPAGTRNSTGLIAYYPFTEQSGTIVHDLSGSATPMDLEMRGNVDWLGGGPGVRFDNGRVGTTGPASDLVAALKSSNSSTFEIWAMPANLIQDGPARLISVGEDPSRQDFIIGQIRDGFQIRFRHSGKNRNGRPRIRMRSGAAVAVQHIVHTYDGSTERLYIDGVEQPVAIALEGTYSPWVTDDLFSIGNEATEDRPFAGVVYLVAVYDRALSEYWVEQNFAAGYDPSGSTQ